MSSGYYDTYEGAKLLGVDAATIRSWVHRGRLCKGQFIGGRLRWTKAQLVRARDHAGRKASLAAAQSMVTEARCGCGSMARAEPGADGFLMVSCPQCGATMAIEMASEYVYRSEANPLEIAIKPDDMTAALASRVAVIRATQSKGQPLVYFIRLGPYVKIGTSVDVRSRIGALSLAPGNLLAVVDGHYDREHQLHGQFARLRAFREWFYLEAELIDFIAGLQRDAVEQFTSEQRVAS